jgi:hypothetical protein
MENKYEFRVSIDLNTDSELETGHVSNFDKENERFVSIVPVVARTREHFMEIAQSVKQAFLRGNDK